MNQKDKSTAGVQSVDRALSILETLGPEPDGLGVTELARALGLKTPTTHNLLRTLAARGYVAQDVSTQKYRLGPACGSLGQLFTGNVRVPQIAQPHLQELSRELNESAVLGMLERGEVAFVARVEADQMLTVSFNHVWVRSAYSSVCGRVLLAYMSRDALDSYVASHSIAKSKDKDIRSKKALLAALARIREQGYCAYWRENETVLAVAAPVFDAKGAPAAAVGVPVPSVRVREGTEDEVIKAVCSTAERISRDLGWRPHAVQP